MPQCTEHQGAVGSKSADGEPVHAVVWQGVPAVAGLEWQHMLRWCVPSVLVRVLVLVLVLGLVWGLVWGLVLMQVLPCG